MRRNIIMIVAGVAVIAIITAIIITDTPVPFVQSNESQIKYETQKITIDNVQLTVEIADDSEKIQKGLMYRNRLPDNQGMLFVFEKESKYQFWMLNMKFNLDMIWINANGKVVHIVENATPCVDATQTSLCTYNPDEPASYVLEVNSGFVKKHGINENSIMKILS